MPLKSWLVLTLGSCSLAFASPVQAQWKQAESENFVVYSRETDAALIRYVRDLETYDLLLRTRTGLTAERPGGTRLSIFLVPNRRGLQQMFPGMNENVAGRYVATSEGIFAAAVQDDSQDYLLHEYFHHFSLQRSGAVLPGWLVEGLAEYFMTAEIEPGSVVIGGSNPGRATAIFNETWPPLDQLVTQRFSEIDARYRHSYYPVAWLLTHWFMSDEPRREQLQTYLRHLGEGMGSTEAMERATGLTMADITRELRGYRRLNALTFTADFPQAEVEIRRLPASADDLLLVAQRLKTGVAADRRAETAQLVRQAAARHPDDPFALVTLGHAELHFGDPAASEAPLKRALELDPENVEALQYLARRELERAREDGGEEAVAGIRRGRAYLAQAYRIDPEDFRTLYLLADSRRGATGYPSENDLVTWSQAALKAPQLSSLILGYGHALLIAEDYEEAEALLRPLANAPHGGSAATQAATLLNDAQARRSPPAEPVSDAGNPDAEPDREPVSRRVRAKPSLRPEITLQG